MKKNDLVIIIIVAAIAGIFSFGVSQALFGSKKSRNLTAEVVDPISADFQQKLDPSVFNGQAINPTKLIQIGDSSNANPF